MGFEVWDTKTSRSGSGFEGQASRSGFEVRLGLRGRPYLLFGTGFGVNVNTTQPVKRHRGEPGHTRDTHGAHGRTRHTGTRITHDLDLLCAKVEVMVSLVNALHSVCPAGAGTPFTKTRREMRRRV